MELLLVYSSEIETMCHLSGKEDFVYAIISEQSNCIDGKPECVVWISRVTYDRVLKFMETPIMQTSSPWTDVALIVTAAMYLQLLYCFSVGIWTIYSVKLYIATLMSRTVCNGRT